TLVAPVRDGASRSGPGKFGDAVPHPLLLRLLLGQPRPGDLGIGVRDRGNYARVEIRLLPGGGLGGDVALVHRLVREHGLTRDVAYGVDMRNAGAHLIVDLDEAARVDYDAGGLRPNLPAVRRAAD